MHTGRHATSLSARKFFAGISLSLLVSTAAISAYADSTIMLQLGQYDNEAAARSSWEILRNSHQKELGALNPVFVPVTTPEGESVFRTMAGAMSSRTAAQDTCTNLEKAGASCLVVETSMQSMPVAQEDAADAAAGKEPVARFVAPSEPMETAAVEQAPQSAPAQAQPAEKKSLGQRVGSWFGFGDDEKKEAAKTAEQPTAAPVMAEAPQPVAAPVETVQAENMPPLADAPALANAPQPQQIQQIQQASQQPAYIPTPYGNAVAARAPRDLAVDAGVATETVTMAPQGNVQGAGQSDVQVAEAIRVPLSNQVSNRYPGSGIQNRPVGYGGFPSQNLPVNTFWAQINNFASKEDAMGYLDLLRYEHPMMMQNLRARIVSSMPRHGKQQQTAVKLRVGPFSSQAEMSRLCTIASMKKLQCSIVKDANYGNQAALRSPYIKGAYARNSESKRHQKLQQGYAPVAQNRGAFWAQLGTFASVQEAERRWADFMAIYPAVFSNLNPQISYPSMSEAANISYNLRVGPYATVASASNVCGNMESRNISCMVMRSK